MRILRLTAIILLLMVAVAANAVTPVVYSIKPIKLTNGWQVTGTISTDGATGYLTAANILDWNLKIVQTTDYIWTQKDSNDLNIAGVISDGKKIYVATSPDGVADGGTLFVGRRAGGGQIETNAVIADFTQLSANLGYGSGGIAGWQSELGSLNFVGLNQRNNTQYRAGSLLAGLPNVFAIHVPTLSTSPMLMTMFGTMTTDGTIGPLLPKNIVAWRITARNQDTSYMNKTNSAVRATSGVVAKGGAITVDHAAGQFVIGVGGARPTFVTIADFTDPAFPNGFANYYVGTSGVMGERSPLVGTNARTYTFAWSGQR